MRLHIFLLLGLAIFLAGCTQVIPDGDITDLARTIPSINELLDDHPAARVTKTTLSFEQLGNDPIFQAKCQGVSPQTLQKIALHDPAENFLLTVFMNAENKIVCAFKESADSLAQYDYICSPYANCTGNACSRKVGDIDGDGSSTPFDIEILSKIIDADENLYPLELCCADIDGDGVITEDDRSTLENAHTSGTDLGMCGGNITPPLQPSTVFESFDVCTSLPTFTPFPTKVQVVCPLTQPLQRGSTLTVYTQLLSETDAPTITDFRVDVSLQGNVIGPNLFCTKDGYLLDNGKQSIFFECTWVAGNAVEGTNEYTFEITASDTEGNTIVKTESQSLTFTARDLSLCKEVIPGHNNTEENRANIVFTGFGYDGITVGTLQEEYTLAPQEIVKQYAELFIDEEREHPSLFAIPPFDTTDRNKFNFWYVDAIGSFDDCIKESDGSWSCSTSTRQILTGHCALQNKHTVFLVDQQFRSFATLPTASSYMILAAPVLACEDDRCLSRRLPGVSENPDHFALSDMTTTFVHEWGHMFGNLTDEYVESPNLVFTGTTPPNSSVQNYYAGPEHTQEECVQNSFWKTLIGNGCGQDGVLDCSPDDFPDYVLEIGCFEGANTVGKGIFRSALQTIMASLDQPFEFGEWNETLLQQRLDLYEGSP